MSGIESHSDLLNEISSRMGPELDDSTMVFVAVKDGRMIGATRGPLDANPDPGGLIAIQETGLDGWILLGFGKDATAGLFTAMTTMVMEVTPGVLPVFLSLAVVGDRYWEIGVDSPEDDGHLWVMPDNSTRAYASRVLAPKMDQELEEEAKFRLINSFAAWGELSAAEKNDMFMELYEKSPFTKEQMCLYGVALSFDRGTKMWVSLTDFDNARPQYGKLISALGSVPPGSLQKVVLLTGAAAWLLNLTEVLTTALLMTEDDADDPLRKMLVALQQEEPTLSAWDHHRTEYLNS